MDYKAQYYKSLYEEQLKKNQYLTKKNTEYFNIITDNEHPPIMAMIENLNNEYDQLEKINIQLNLDMDKLKLNNKSLNEQIKNQYLMLYSIIESLIDEAYMSGEEKDIELCYRPNIEPDCININKQLQKIVNDVIHDEHLEAELSGTVECDFEYCIHTITITHI